MTPYERTVELMHEALLDGFHKGLRGLQEPSRLEAEALVWKFVVMAAHSIQEGQ